MAIGLLDTWADRESCHSGDPEVTNDNFVLFYREFFLGTVAGLRRARAGGTIEHE